MEVVGTNEFTSKYQSILIILTATANYIKILTLSYVGRGDRDRMVVEFITSYAISAYHQ
jgi:hypothetical protein